MFDSLEPTAQPIVSPLLRTALLACEQALQPEFQVVEFGAACQKLGSLLQGMGRFEEATLWHTHALASQPDFAKIYAGVGQVHLLQQQWQAAEKAYRKALQHNRNCAEAYWKLGAIALQQEQRPQALQFWYHALALEPQKATVDGHIRLGHAFYKLKQIDHALACYRRAIRLKPNNPDAYRALATVFTDEGRQDDAIATYQQAIEAVDNPGWAFYQWGVLLRQNHHIDDALTVFIEATQRDPDFPWTHHDAIELLLSQERWQDAITLCNQAIAIQSFPWAYSQMGRALGAVGKRDEAIACHQTASDLRGWHACKQRNYQFTQDWFTHNIPIWLPLLQEWINIPNIHALEIGSFQGMSACWLLDTVLTHPTACLTSIDPGVQPEFTINLAKTGADHKVTQHVGNSHVVLPKLSPETYTFIYIDGCHLASHVKQDGFLAWPLLKPGGLLIFDDYLWSDPHYPGQDPKQGIDEFLDTIHHHIQIVHHGYQVIARKTAPTPC
ncbi:MAG: tetratricopeptide repeat protein [Cyanobacteria bacterium P01_A01_bin.37]